jgi:DNA-binding transcriptional LysR family regulator
VGFVKSAMWTAVLPRALVHFSASRPAIALDLQAARSADQARRVLAGDLDLALVHEPAAAPGLEHRVLLSERLLLAVPRAHPLARRRGVLPADLHGVDWIALALPSEAKTREAFATACSRAGFVPNLRVVVSDQMTALGLVDAGFGCAFLPRSVEAEARPGVRLRKLPWLRRSRTLYASWRAGAAHPALLDLVRHLEAEARAERRTAGAS